MSPRRERRQIPSTAEKHLERLNELVNTTPNSMSSTSSTVVDVDKSATNAKVETSLVNNEQEEKEKLEEKEEEEKENEEAQTNTIRGTPLTGDIRCLAGIFVLFYFPK